MTTFRVDCATGIGDFDHFWRSTGFTPASWLLEPAMRQTIAYLGSIPHRGLRYCRIHFLLDLVGGTELLGEAPVYDWSRLDQGLDLLIDNGLAPFFELMGNPGDAFSDLDDPAQIAAWGRLVEALARHCIDRYGAAEVRDWYFETWNEPDLPWWQHSRPTFLAYYDACSAALAAVDPQLRFGGPGSCETLHPFFTELMDHVAATGARCDFISVHEKGGKWSDEDVSPRIDLIIDSTRRAVEWLRERHPQLATKPLFNDECDPLIGWKQYHSWRGRPYYAAFLCRLIDRHIRDLRDADGVAFGFLSSDNGFLGRWGQRSQLAVFGDGQGGLESDRFELIKKPVLNVLSLLALLGDERLAVALPAAPGDLGVLATRRGADQVAVLVHANRDRTTSSARCAGRLQLAGLAPSIWRHAEWRLDEDHGNPMAIWEAGGYPDDPSRDPAACLWPDRPDPGLYAAMRRHHEVPLAAPPADVVIDADGRLELTFDLPLHSVALHVFSRDPGRAPAAPQGLRGNRYQGRIGGENLLLRWDCLGDRHLRSYRVESAEAEQGPWTVLHEEDLLATAWLHARPAGAAPRWYRIRAHDYWGRSSGPGPAVQL